jgi:hypothetical protein
LPDDAVGLGLSGGGVRSATFCLGLFQAIGQAGRLRDIDVLSTVYYLDNHARSWLLYIKATLMGDEPEDVRHYHRAHPDFRRKRRSISSSMKLSGRAIGGLDCTPAIACSRPSFSTTFAVSPVHGSQWTWRRLSHYKEQ